MTLTIDRTQLTTEGFSEDLGNDTLLEMVLIPSGEFLMGSPEDELERRANESPQHRVTVSTFLMGQYPITNAQWNAVVKMPRVNQKLSAKDKSDRYPVTRVSWRDAQEFCDRLSRFTDRPYGLPSEAEWEYACRAGTTTPFAFGETLTPELANYNWSYTYGDFGVEKQKSPGGVTIVGQYPANAFGLYDMHGNVWEWCADDWHGNYEGAPEDSSAWRDRNAKTTSRKVIRGGSWIYYPGLCRSAFRSLNGADSAVNDLGFRVVCRPPRTL
jgi:formylglycine-generating enzyme required for sulfatase activity